MPTYYTVYRLTPVSAGRIEALSVTSGTFGSAADAYHGDSTWTGTLPAEPLLWDGVDIKTATGAQVTASDTAKATDDTAYGGDTVFGV